MKTIEHFFLNFHFLSQVYCLESSHIFQNVLENVAKYNNIHDRIKWITSAENVEKEIDQANDKVRKIALISHLYEIS